MVSLSALMALGEDDLDQFVGSLGRNSTFRQGAQILGSWQPERSTWDPWESLGVSFLQALGSGILGNVAQEREAEQLRSVVDVLPALYSDPMSVEVPDGVDADAFQRLRGAAALKKEFRDTAEAIRDEERRADLIRDVFGVEIEGAKARARRLGEQAAIEETVPGRLADVSLGDMTPRRFGDGETLNDKRDAIIRQGIAMGMTPNQAAAEARDRLQAERLANKESVDRVQYARDLAATLDKIASTAEAGVEGAGATGGILDTPRNIASSIWAIFSPEERRQRAATGLIDSVAPDVIAIARKPGSGATSDFEARAFLGSGPSSDKTPEENRLLIENMRNFAAIQRDYADFLEAYREERGTTVGADRLWRAYTDANPLFHRLDDGQLVANTTRTPWQEFDFISALRRRDKPQTDRGASGSWDGANIPPGMKLQRNVRTGETRLVPQ